MTSRAAYLVGARIKRRCAAPQQQPALRAQVGGSKNSEYCANWRSPGN
jgi:hypothetical protein